MVEKTMNELKQRAFVCRMAQKLCERNSWCGETHLQKALYIAGAVCGLPLSYGFDLYFYGPYSFDLKTDLIRMQADEFLQSKIVRPGYGSTLEVVPESTEVLMRKHWSEDLNPEVEFISEWFGRKGVSDLEKLATAHFVSEKNRGKPNDEMAAILHRIKPHINHQEALTAIDEVVRKEGEWRERSR